MPNYQLLEDAALFGIEESLEFELDRNEFLGDYPVLFEEEGHVAEAIYAKAKGWC